MLRAGGTRRRPSRRRRRTRARAPSANPRGRPRRGPPCPAGGGRAPAGPRRRARRRPRRCRPVSCRRGRGRRPRERPPGAGRRPAGGCRARCTSARGRATERTAGRQSAVTAGRGSDTERFLRHRRKGRRSRPYPTAGAPDRRSREGRAAAPARISGQCTDPVGDGGRSADDGVADDLVRGEEAASCAGTVPSGLMIALTPTVETWATERPCSIARSREIANCCSDSAV